MRHRIPKVDSAEVYILKSNPPKIGVIGHGTVPFAAWHSPSLDPWFYITPPADGIQDFDFTAQLGTIIEAVPIPRPITAEAIIDRDPADYWGKGKPLVGVRLHAQQNSV